MINDIQDPDGLLEILQTEADEAVARVGRQLHVAQPPDRGSPCHLACQAYAARRERRHFFDPNLFADPAWDMLLVMYCAHLDGKQLTVTSVVQASEVPYTTGLRWLTTVEKSGLVSRSRHPSDKRSAMLKMTSLGVEKMEAYLERLREKELMLV